MKKIILAAVFAILSSALFGELAVTGTGGATANATSLFYNITLSSAINPVLFTSICIPNSITVTVSAVSYNGQAMTAIGSTRTAGVFMTYLYMLSNPTSDNASHPVSITIATKQSVNATSFCVSEVAFVMTPVVQAYPGTSQVSSLTITTQANRSWIIGTFSGASSAGHSFTEPSRNIIAQSGTTSDYMLSGYVYVTTAATTNITDRTAGGGSAKAAVGVEIQQWLSPTFTATGTFTATKTITQTHTITPTFTATPTMTPAVTFYTTPVSVSVMNGNTFTLTSLFTFVGANTESKIIDSYDTRYIELVAATPTPSGYYNDTPESRSDFFRYTANTASGTVAALYRVISGDLSSLSMTSMFTINDSEHVLAQSTVIINVITATQTLTRTATKTATATMTPTMTHTNTTVVSRTPTNTSTSQKSSTPTSTITMTRTLNGTRTSTPTNTPQKTSTKSNTATPTRTPTGTATKTVTQTNTPSPTITMTSTAVITPTFTNTACPMSWSSDNVVVLLLENNVTNSGSGAFTFTNTGSIPYDSSRKHDGAYSLGQFSNDTQSLTSGSVITANIKTLSFWIYYPTSADTSRSIFSAVEPAIDSLVCRVSTTTFYLYDYARGGSVSLDFTPYFDKWTHFGITWDGSNCKLYLDNVYKGQFAWTGDVGQRVWNFGNLTPDGYSNSESWYDNIIMSTSVYTTFPIEATLNCPSATITPTLTVTNTSTATLTATFTVTPTKTATSTNTPIQTKTITQTRTPLSTRTATSTRTPVKTFTKTSTVSATPTPRQTKTITPTLTSIYTKTATPTRTSVVVYTKTITPTRTPVGSLSTKTITSTRTPLKTSTATKSITATRTVTLTKTVTSTITVTRTASATKTITPTATLNTLAVAGLKASISGDTVFDIYLHWTPKSGSGWTYTIYKSVVTNTAYATATTGVTANNYVDTAHTTSAAYFYKVEAINTALGVTSTGRSNESFVVYAPALTYKDEIKAAVYNLLRWESDINTVTASVYYQNKPATASFPCVIYSIDTTGTLSGWQWKESTNLSIRIYSRDNDVLSSLENKIAKSVENFAYEGREATIYRIKKTGDSGEILDADSQTWTIESSFSVSAERKNY